MAEIGELLGGPVEAPLAELTDRLRLCVRADWAEAGEPIRYAWDRLGRASQPVAGDCAVVRVGPGGRLGNVRAADLDTVNERVRPVDGKGRP